MRVLPQPRSPVELFIYYMLLCLLVFPLAIAVSIWGISTLLARPIEFQEVMGHQIVYFISCLLATLATVTEGKRLGYPLVIKASFVNWAAAIIAAVAVQVLIVALYRLWPALAESANPELSQKLPPLWMVIAAVLIAPVAEEYIFREAVFSWFRTSRSLIYSAVVTTLIFAAVHFTAFLTSPLSIIALLLVSSLCMMLRISSRSIGPGILAHSLSNLIACREIFGFQAV